jgi:hypothetical protein
MFPMLICAISLFLHKTMTMAIHNQYPDIKLVSPVYFHNLRAYYEYPVERTNTGTVVKMDLRLNLDKLPGGILMYEVQRKENTGFNYQSGIDTMHAKVIENTSKVMRLLVTWKTKRYGGPKVNIILVEYDDEPVLNEDKLMQLYDKANILPSGHEFSECTWLMCNDAVLPAIRIGVWRGGPELNINISKGFKDRDVIRPTWIDLKT